MELGGLNLSEGDLGGRVPLRKCLSSKEYLDWFNDTGITLSYSVQCKNLLKFIEIYLLSIATHDLFPMFTQSINFYILSHN